MDAGIKTQDQNPKTPKPQNPVGRRTFIKYYIVLRKEFQLAHIALIRGLPRPLKRYLQSFIAQDFQSPLYSLYSILRLNKPPEMTCLQIVFHVVLSELLEQLQGLWVHGRRDVRCVLVIL